MLLNRGASAVEPVTRWRKALRVKATKGTKLRLSEGVRASAPARAAKIAAAKRGKPRPPHVIEALRKANTGKPLSKTTRRKMSETRKRLGIRPPWLPPAWTAAEDKLLRTLPQWEVVKRTGRTLAAVLTRRSALGINNGRRTRWKRK